MLMPIFLLSAIIEACVSRERPGEEGGDQGAVSPLIPRSARHKSDTSMVRVRRWDVLLLERELIESAERERADWYR